MEANGREGCVVEMCDLSGKDRNQICKDRNNSSQDESSSVENQDVEIKECHVDSKDFFVRRNDTTPVETNHRTQAEMENTDKKESMTDSTRGVFPHPISSPLLENTFSDINASQFVAQLSEFRAESHQSHQRPTSGNWKNSFYARLSLEYIVCSTFLAFVIPVLGIPAVVYSIRSYKACKRGDLQQSRHLSLHAFRLILVSGALLCCLAMITGFLTAYLLISPIEIVTESPTMEIKATSSQHTAAADLFYDQARELLDGRHNVSVFCQSRNPRCHSSNGSVSSSSDQRSLPLDDPSWNPPEPLATLVRRSETKVLKSPVAPKPPRGGSNSTVLN